MRLIKVGLVVGAVAAAVWSCPPARKYIQTKAADFRRVFDETEYDLRLALLPKTADPIKGRHRA